MQLIDNYLMCFSEDTRDIRSVAHEDRFERLRRDQPDATRISEKPLLRTRRDVAMPPMYGNVELLAKLVETAPLIVNQCFQRSNVHSADALACVFGHQP